MKAMNYFDICHIYFTGTGHELTQQIILFIDICRLRVQNSLIQIYCKTSSGINHYHSITHQVVTRCLDHFLTFFLINILG